MGIANFGRMECWSNGVMEYWKLSEAKSRDPGDGKLKWFTQKYPKDKCRLKKIL
jgi:hypothetical protein